MSRFQVRAKLPAHPADVWRELTDLGAYPEWNPFIVRASGRLQAGEEFTIHLRMGGPSPTRLRTRITAVEDEKELRWRWVLLHEGLFTADRYLLLEAEGDATRFVQGEAWSGLLTPVFKSFGVHRQLLGNLRAMSAALRERVGRDAATGVTNR